MLHRGLCVAPQRWRPPQRCGGAGAAAPPGAAMGEGQRAPLEAEFLLRPPQAPPRCKAPPLRTAVLGFVVRRRSRAAVGGRWGGFAQSAWGGSSHSLYLSGRCCPFPVELQVWERRKDMRYAWLLPCGRLCPSKPLGHAERGEVGFVQVLLLNRCLPAVAPRKDRWEPWRPRKVRKAMWCCEGCLRFWCSRIEIVFGCPRRAYLSIFVDRPGIV